MLRRFAAFIAVAFKGCMGSVAEQLQEIYPTSLELSIYCEKKVLNT